MYPIIAIFLGSLIVALLGRNCRFGFWGMLFVSLLFTPIIGILLLLVMSSTPSKTT